VSSWLAGAAGAADAPADKVVCAAQGTIVPGQLVLVCAKVPGQVVKLQVEPGTVVKAGQVVAELDATVAKLEVERLRAKVAAAKARAQEVKALGGGSARMAVAEAELAIAEAELRLGEVVLENTQIRALIDGTILNRQADVGLVIDSGRSAPLYEMADLRNSVVAVDVPESMRERLFDGQLCRIQRPGSQKVYRGKVLRVYPAADPATATIPARVRIEDKAEELRPGTVVSVEFLARE
jgi:multidrug efflux pump subunit AcrA (membrane-fusion protein)